VVPCVSAQLRLVNAGQRLHELVQLLVGKRRLRMLQYATVQLDVLVELVLATNEDRQHLDGGHDDIGHDNCNISRTVYFIIVIIIIIIDIIRFSLLFFPFVNEYNDRIIIICCCFNVDNGQAIDDK
jgi:hypothetical protein